MPRLCVVKGCGTRNGAGVKFHTFPKDPDMRQQWINVIGCSKNIGKDSVVCAQHFDSSSIEIPLKNQMMNYYPRSTRFLKKDAVPTLKLPTSPVLTCKRFMEENAVPTLPTEEKTQECMQPIPFITFVDESSVPFFELPTGTKMGENTQPIITFRRQTHSEQLKLLQIHSVEPERNVKEMCNLCLDLVELESLTDEQFSNFVFIEPQINSKLPRKICKDCLDKLSEMVEFFKKCKRSCQILEKMKINCSTTRTVDSTKLPPSNLNKNHQTVVQDHIGCIKTEAIDSESTSLTTARLVQDINLHEDKCSVTETCKTENTLDEVNPFPTETASVENSASTSLPFEPLKGIKKNKRHMPTYRRWFFVKNMLKNRNPVKKKPIKSIKSIVINQTRICEKCGETVSDGMANHYKINQCCKPRNFKCTFCNCYFSSFSKMTNHQIAKHRSQITVQNIVCHICGKSFQYRTSLRRHLVFHETGKRFMCEICGNMFATSETLRNHVNTHTNERPFACGYCGETFKSSIKRAAHERKHKENLKKSNSDDTTFNQQFIKSNLCKSRTENREHACNLCTVEKTSPSIQKSPTKQPVFECELCHRRLSSKHGLQRHVAIHDARPRQVNQSFKCDQCGKTVNGQNNLKRHIVLAHTIKKSFYCHVCNKGFYYEHSKDKHVREVHGEEELGFGEERSVENES